MITDIARVVDAIAGLRVCVIGDAMLDSYHEGTSGRLCREAPVPIVAVRRRVDVPGGAANTAANVRALGARVVFLSAVGDDPEAALLRRALDERGVETEHVLGEPGRRTLAKQRVVAGSQMVVRFDHGDGAPLGREAERAVVARLRALAPTCDAIVVSDYGYGVLTPRVIRALVRAQASAPRVLVVDSKHLVRYRSAAVTAIKPNYEEALELLGGHPFASAEARVELIAQRGHRLLDLTQAQIAAITLDTEGALFFERGAPPYRTYARPAAHSRATGAGDTFVAALGLALAAGASMQSAAEVASAAAAVVVGKDGTAACSAGELRLQMAGDAKHVDVPTLLARVAAYRQQGRRIVFTNGCFDILHRGHVTYLNGAKALGDVLVVGVNSDDGVRRLKGEQRPINPLEDRLNVLAALSCIDHLVAFEEDTPAALIRALRPDVFVKGGDYTRATLPEARLVEAQGGTVQILPYVDARSTTSIIERIRAAYPRMADDAPPGSRTRDAVDGLGSRQERALRSA